MPDPTAELCVTQAMEALRAGRFAEAGGLVQRAVDIDINVVRGRHVKLAHVMLLAADWRLITRMVPTKTNSLVVSGWLNSIQLGRPVSADSKPVPWFTYPAIDFVEQKIKSTWRVLEWGCGASTLWWATRVQGVFSVEHHAEWHKHVTGQAPANVSVQLATEMQAYLDAPRAQGAAPFDVVVIDGEWRNECAREATSLVKESGLIIFDNSDRKGFREGVEHLGSLGWKRIDFFGLIPSYLYRNCTSVFYKDESLLQGQAAPCFHQSCLGPTCAQAMRE